jgi:hypothetical protein
MMTVVKEVLKYELDLVGVQDIGLDRGGTEPACDYTFSVEIGVTIMTRARILMTCHLFFFM